MFPGQLQAPCAIQVNQQSTHPSFHSSCPISPSPICLFLFPSCSHSFFAVSPAPPRLPVERVASICVANRGAFEICAHGSSIDQYKQRPFCDYGRWPGHAIISPHQRAREAGRAAGRKISPRRYSHLQLHQLRTAPHLSPHPVQFGLAAPSHFPIL
jgi:hypothetical protein